MLQMGVEVSNLIKLDIIARETTRLLEASERFGYSEIVIPSSFLKLSLDDFSFFVIEKLIGGLDCKRVDHFKIDNDSYSVNYFNTKICVTMRRCGKLEHIRYHREIIKLYAMPIESDKK